MYSQHCLYKLGKGSKGSPGAGGGWCLLVALGTVVIVSGSDKHTV